MIVGQKLADKLVSMRHDWGGLREDIAHLQTAMTEGSTRIREEADASAQDAAQQVCPSTIQTLLSKITLNCRRSNCVI